MVRLALLDNGESYTCWIVLMCLSTGTRYLVPGTPYQLLPLPGTRYQVPIYIPVYISASYIYAYNFIQIYRYALAPVQVSLYVCIIGTWYWYLGLILCRGSVYGVHNFFVSTSSATTTGTQYSTRYSLPRLLKSKEESLPGTHYRYVVSASKGK